ncbi:hypothetical protein T484DRAFT_1611100 [Baffinella frigidus]|nr:hypothetical protein T484DRAFT_1611100 [Cryptophyta sp. CCMP2293]
MVRLPISSLFLCSISGAFIRGPLNLALPSRPFVTGRDVRVASRRGGEMSAEGMARSKVVHLVRHGQAQHNPRAEKARNAGCDTPTFLELMRQDDAFDAALTPTGLEQAAGASQHSIRGVELIVASSLSRAIDTADIIFPPGENPASTATGRLKSVSAAGFREISGRLLNAKLRTRSELSGRNPSWDFSGLHSETTPPPSEDGLWTPDLEGEAACAERAYLGLRWLWDRPEHHAVLTRDIRNLFGLEGGGLWLAEGRA